MAKRQQITKLLAVMAMTSIPAAQAGPEHGHAHGPGPAPPAARAPAPQPCEDAVPARTAPRSPREAPAARAPAGAPAAAAAVVAPAASPTIDAILALFGLARVRELPNGRPAPGNVTSRAPSGKLR